MTSSAVTCSTSARLGIASGTVYPVQVVVAKSGHLEVYGVALKDCKLSLLLRVPFFGQIFDVRAFKPSGREMDAILVSTEDSRLSVLEYDPRKDDFVTISLHTFEECQLASGRFNERFIPTLAIDPENRCAAVVSSHSSIGLLPMDLLMTPKQEPGAKG